MKSAITQEHGFGCGVACVAQVLKISYKKTLKKFQDPCKAWSEGYYCRDLVHVLNKSGKKYSYCYIKENKTKLLRKTGTIVYCRKCLKYPAGHYLVRTSKGWMNPWINFPIIHPTKSTFVKKLPSKPIYAIFEIE